MKKRNTLASSAKQLEAVVTVVATESGGERVVLDESGGECGGDDVEGVVSGGGIGCEVGTEVTEGDVKIGVGVEVGEREEVVLVEGWCGRGHEGGV